MKYYFVLEKAEQNYVAYVPDLPGFVVSGKTADETRKAMKEAITMHLKGLVADGLPVPVPSVQPDYMDTIQPPDTEEPKRSGLRKLMKF